MTEIATRDDRAPALPESIQDSPLIVWAYQAQQAHRIAQSLARTSFVPASMRGKPDDITAAILAGDELGLRPMASLRAMDIIQGTPALRAHAMRGLVQSRGHEIELVESTETRCRMRGRRQGAEAWQMVTWTIERASRLGLTGKPQWKQQPQTMLVARATAEICRLIASDVLYAMPYAAEELSDDLPPSIVGPTESAPRRRTTRRRAQPAEPLPEIEPEFEAPDEEPAEPEPTGDTPPPLDGWGESGDWPTVAEPGGESQ